MQVLCCVSLTGREGQLCVSFATPLYKKRPQTGISLEIFFERRARFINIASKEKYATVQGVEAVRRGVR